VHKRVPIPSVRDHLCNPWAQRRHLVSAREEHLRARDDLAVAVPFSRLACISKPFWRHAKKVIRRGLECHRGKLRSLGVVDFLAAELIGARQQVTLSLTQPSRRPDRRPSRYRSRGSRQAGPTVTKVAPAYEAGNEFGADGGGG
jgi:hypothetical protein